MPSFSASITRCDAAAVHVVLVWCHHSVLRSTIRAYYYCSGVVRGLFWVKTVLIPPGTWCWHCYGLLAGTAPNRSIHAPKSARNSFIHACVFILLSHPRVFSAHDFAKLPPFRNSYPGSHGTHSSPFATTVLAFVLIARKKLFRNKFSSLASFWVELVYTPATHQHITQHAGCEALSAVSLYADAFASGFDLDRNKHTSFLQKIYLLWFIFTDDIVSISCDVSHGIGIEISRIYSRYWYRCMPKISHDISGIL